MIILGFSWALINAHYISSWELKKQDEGRELIVSGYISSLPQNATKFSAFTFDTDKARLKLNWYGEHTKLIPGNKWQLAVRLKRPHATLNPGCFDIERNWFEHHIRANGYVVNSEANQLLNTGFWHYPILYLRYKLKQRILQAQLQQPLSGVLAALIIGDESKITKDEWQTMQQTGTSYLVAISGLHIGLVAGIIFAFVNYLWRRSARLPLYLPAKNAAAVASFVVAVIYSMFSGFSIPTQRAMIMLTVFLGAQFFKQHLPPWIAFFYALFCVVIINPFSVLSIGFWLSFTAVALIIFITQGRKNFNSSNKIDRGRIVKWFAKIFSIGKKYLYLQIALTLGLMPFTLLIFQQASFAAIIANIIAMPGVCLLVVPLGLFGVILPGMFGSWILWLANKLLGLIWMWLVWVANLHLLYWHYSVVNYWVFAATVVAIIIILMPRGFPAKAVGLIWFLPLFCYHAPTPKYGEYWFTLLDVGQGLASVLQTEHHVLVYDTGLKLFTTDSGEMAVNPFLLKSGIHDIDILMVSHGDNDHFGGAASVIAQNHVYKIMTSVPEKFGPQNAQHCWAGEAWTWDGVSFKVLSPEVNSTFGGNDASCVLQVSNGKNVLLLTGDIEKPTEKSLLEAHSEQLKSTILVAPHHGSATSSTRQFIEAVHPKIVLFPVGYKNRFHFPAKFVIQRYNELGIQMFDTASLGAITCKVSDSIAQSMYRITNHHFWND